jgi:hypothetical protein
MWERRLDQLDSELQPPRRAIMIKVNPETDLVLERKTDVKPEINGKALTKPEHQVTHA